MGLDCLPGLPSWRAVLGLAVLLASLWRCEAVDESLYSRQLYVLGMPAQQRLAESNVLLIGLGGVGVEIAKNLILTGPRSVTLLDPTPASVEDLSCQYYLSEASVGQPRDRACVARLKELNPLVHVEVLKTGKGAGSLSQLEQAVLQGGGKYDVIVCADKDQDAQEKLNELARRLGAKFVSAEARGLCGSIFCDLGDEFTVLDKDGREPATGVIAKIVQDKHETVVRLVEGQRHELQVGDVLALEGCDGLTAGGEDEALVVRRVVNATSFVVRGTQQLGTYKQGGAFRQIKQPVNLSFVPLSRARALLESVPTDFGKASLDRQATMLAAFAALPRFLTSKKRLPRAGSEADAEAFVKLARASSVVKDVVAAKRLKREPQLQQDVLARFARTCRGGVAPVCSFIGGSAAQEVVKACTGHSMPLQQFLFFDAFEALPEGGYDQQLPTEEDCKPLGDRYDGLRAVFGSRLLDQAIRRNMRVFVVGAGAIGCELLKNLALMGVSEVTVTDNDTIEKSNLNRQFLFREKDIGSPKSEAAARAVAGLNGEVRVTALTRKVGKDTEAFFNDEFWAQQDVVMNALDNVAARLYVDGRCVYYRKPLLESGTEGTSGNVQVIVPHLSESYGSSVDPPEASIPVCTLKSFPYRIEHCIQWARDYFDGFFRIQPERLSELVGKLSGADDASAAAVLSELRSTSTDEMVLRELEQALTDLEIWDPVPSFRRCVKWALDRFHELYDVNIRALLKEHPAGSVDEEGEPFWTGDRKMPTPAGFDPRDRLHLDFVVSATLLKARAFNVLDSQKRGPDIEAMLLAVLNEILPEYQALEPVAQPSDPAELDARIKREFEEVREVIGRISARPGKYSTIPETFEKDRDENGHMDFITAASNLRAINYGIAPADRLQTKKIAGRIIPAIATTTAVVAGLASLELFKLAQAQAKPLGAYKNAFINLAGPFFALTEPMEATPVAMGENGQVYTMWDRLEVRPKRDLTVRQFLVQVQKQYGIRVSSVTFQQSRIIYADFLHGETDPVLEATISDLVCAEGEERRFIDLEVESADEDDEEVESPPVRYFFPPKRDKIRWKGWFSRVSNAVSSLVS